MNLQDDEIIRRDIVEIIDKERSRYKVSVAVAEYVKAKLAEAENRGRIDERRVIRDVLRINTSCNAPCCIRILGGLTNQSGGEE